MSFACVRVPHVALRVAILAQPELDGQPLVLRPPTGRREVVADLTPEAVQRGIRLGMSLREVPVLCPEAVVCAPHPMRERVILDRIFGQLEALSPLVAPDPDEPGSFFVDLRGLDRHYGSPAAAAQALLAAIPPLLRPRVGVAPILVAARLAAGRAAPSGCRIIAPAALTTFLREMTLAELPSLGELRLQFEQLGIRTFGELADLPAAAVAARFGPAGRLAWEWATGHDERRIQPRSPTPIVVEHLNLATPATSRETCLLALKRLVLRAFNRPLLRQRHVRQIDIRAELEGGAAWEQRLVLRAPSDRDRLLQALALRLQQLTLPGPVEALTVELSGLTPATASQEPLIGLGFRPRRPRQVAEAARQLTQRYGHSPLFRIVEVEPWSRIPERRYALIRYAP